MTATSKRSAAKPTPRPIRDVLPVCSSGYVDVMRRLFAAPRGHVAVGDTGITLRIRPAQPTEFAW